MKKTKACIRGGILTLGMPVLFVSTGKISVFLLNWPFMLQPCFAQISWVTAGINTLISKQPNPQNILLIVQHLRWYFEHCRFSYKAPVPNIVTCILSKLQRRQELEDWDCQQWVTTLLGHIWCWPGQLQRCACCSLSLFRCWVLSMAKPGCSSVLGWPVWVSSYSQLLSQSRPTIWSWRCHKIHHQHQETCQDSSRCFCCLHSQPNPFVYIRRQLLPVRLTFAGIVTTFFLISIRH